MVNVISSGVGRVIFPVVARHAIAALAVIRNLGNADILVGPVTMDVNGAVILGRVDGEVNRNSLDGAGSGQKRYE